MKKKALALALVLCMVIAMLPVSASAAPVNRASARFQFTDVLDPAALPDQPAETNGSYSITLKVVSGKDHGEVELYSSTANHHDLVYMRIDPDPGYLAEIEYEYEYRGFEARMDYALDNLYVLTMSDGDVIVKVKFVKASGTNHKVKVEIEGDPNGGTVTVSQTKAKPDESIFVEMKANRGYTCMHSVRTASGEDVRGAYIDSDGSLRMEILMPNEDLIVTGHFVEQDPYKVHVNIFEGGSAVTNRSTAYGGDEITIAVTADPGWRLTEIVCRTPTNDTKYELTPIGENQWSMTMPHRDIVFDVKFERISYPLSVTVETGLGGTASLRYSSAKVGDTITLVCTPQEGYRVARISGVDGVTDNQNGTYNFTMPPRAVELKVLFLRHENPFLDVNETHFFYDSVLWAVEEGITSGMTPDTFGPFAVCNRAQVVTFLWRYAGSPEPTTTENPFTDVPAEGWFTKPVLWALENGITQGVSATEFGPNLACNRAQVVTFLWRLMQEPQPGLTEHPFTDVEVGSWYEAPVLWALENGITTGATADTFNPNGQCQRAQVVTFLYRTAQLPVYYDIYCEFDAEKGTVTLSHEMAQAGETVTAAVTPAEGYEIESVTCLDGTEITQLSDGEYSFVMPEQDVVLLVTFAELPVEPTDPEPTEPTEPEPTDPTEPEEPVKTYELDLRDNGSGKVAYVDGKTTAAPGESIFFYAVPNEGYYLDHVGIFNPDGSIDVSQIQIFEHDNNLYELVMIDRDIIMTCYFYPIG